MSLIEDLDQLEAKAKELIEGAATSDALEQARVALLGRKGEITSVMHMMGKVAPEERPVLGKRANELRRMAETLIADRGGALKRAAMRDLMATEAVDVTLPGARPKIGHPAPHQPDHRGDGGRLLRHRLHGRGRSARGDDLLPPSPR